MILFVVREVRLALLEERFRLPARQSEDTPDLLASPSTLKPGAKAPREVLPIVSRLSAET